jgi:hypothetical protein
MGPSTPRSRARRETSASCNGSSASSSRRERPCGALAIKEAVYGLEHPQVARTLGNLGNVQQELGEPEQARAHMQRAVRILVCFLGTDRDDTVQARALLASIDNPADAAIAASLTPAICEHGRLLVPGRRLRAQWTRAARCSCAAGGVRRSRMLGELRAGRPSPNGGRCRAVRPAARLPSDRRDPCRRRTNG